MQPLATRAAAFFVDLTALLWAWAARSHAEQPAWSLLSNYIARTQVRLERLILQWQSGTLPPPRPPRAATPRKPTANPAPRPPRRRAWMLKRAGYHAAAHVSRLQHLLDQPDTQKFLAEVPRAGRLLRPLAYVLGLDPIPAPLALPPRPRPAPTPRAPRPRPPPIDLPANIRAAARAWKRWTPAKKPAPA